MLDKKGVLSDLLRALRQKATQDFICLIESIAGDLEVESAPLSSFPESGDMPL